MLSPGHNLLLNQRRWHLRQVRSSGGRCFELEAIGTSAASQGLTRRMIAVRYGNDLFIEQPHQRYWHGHLERDWHENAFEAALQCQPATALDMLDAHTRHVALGELKNEFSWSYSRSGKYQTCPRAYYYHYYAAWEGWDKNAPTPVKRAYILKNLTDLPRWVGSVVHETIKFALARLKAGQPVPAATLLAQMRTRAQTDFAESRSGRYQRQSNQLTGFQEHYYRPDLPHAAWQTAWTTAEQYLKTFLDSALYDHLRWQPANTFLDVEALKSFTVAGRKVWVQMDLARREDKTIYIYDWKTGAAGDEPALRRQLGIYGLYLQRIQPELFTAESLLKGVVYNLAEDCLIEFDVEKVLLKETQAMIEASLAQLQSLLLDPVANLAEMRRFPMIDDLEICRRCQFRELCGRDK